MVKLVAAPPPGLYYILQPLGVITPGLNIVVAKRVWPYTADDRGLHLLLAVVPDGPTYYWNSTIRRMIPYATQPHQPNT